MADEGKLDHLAGVDEEYEVPKEAEIRIETKVVDFNIIIDQLF